MNFKLRSRFLSRVTGRRWAVPGLFCVLSASANVPASSLAIAATSTIAWTTTLLVAPPAEAKKRRAKQPEAIQVEIKPQSFTLENGLRVFVLEDHSTPAFNISILYNVGSRDEVSGRTGFAHFFEHMMFQGSKNLPPMAIANYTMSVGGNMNASTSYDVTTYYHNLPSQYLDMVLWGEADRLRSLDINQDSFETQRQAVISEKQQRIDNQPYQAALEFEMLADLFSGTPYAHPVIGSLEDLQAATTKDVQEFFNKYYHPGNGVVAIVGDVEFEHVKSRVEHYFASIPKGAAKPEPPKGEQRRGEKIEKAVTDLRAPQTMFAIGWPTIPEAHADRPALDLLGQILFSGDSARLPRTLVDERKLAVGAGGGHSSFNQAGYMFLQVMPSPNASADDVRSILRAELVRVAKKGVTGPELQRALNERLLDVVRTLATNQGRATAIARGALFYDDPAFMANDLARYRSVTPKDIQRVAATYLNENWIFYAIEKANTQ